MWEIPFLRSGESMVDCRTTPKKNLKEIIFPTTVTFNDMRSKRLFTNGFFSPRMLENVLWTKQVFQYAKVSIWGCHFKRCWFWWQKFLPLPLLIPTPVSQLTISLLPTISAVPQAVLSAQLGEERREQCWKSRKF